MSVLPAPPPVLSGVDAVLLAITRDAVDTSITVTAGPLDRPVGTARLNWFLYRITPAAAYLNMEPPSTGWTTRRGRPPLALTLHYLLSADPGELSPSGNETEAVHNALTAVMMVLHENPILGSESVVGNPPKRTVGDVADGLEQLVEPLRITLDPVPLETVTGLWASGLKSLRVSVAYQVSLVIVPSPVPFTPGPPVLERVVAVSPSVGPRIDSPSPAMTGSGGSVTIEASGLGQLITVELSRSPGDPDDPDDGRLNPATTHSSGPWRLPSVTGPLGLSAALPDEQLVPGRRVLTVTNLAGGLPAGSASVAVTIAPKVVSANAPLQVGQTATLRVNNILEEGSVNFSGISVPYERTDATTVTVVVPEFVDSAAGQTIPVSITSGTVTGPPIPLEVEP